MRRVLVLDDDKNRHAAFARNLKGHDVTHVYSVAEAIARVVAEPAFDVFFLDHDLGDFADDANGYFSVPTQTGLDFARWMVERMPSSKAPDLVWVHSWNIDGAKSMCSLLRDRIEHVRREMWSLSTGRGLR